MSTIAYFGLVPRDPEVDFQCDMGPHDQPLRTMPIGAALCFAASDPNTCLVVTDIGSLAVQVFGSPSAAVREQGRRNLWALAAAGRLVCLKVASCVARDAGEQWTEVPANSGPDALANLGETRINDLRRIATAAGVSDATIAAFGPLGVYARIRGSIICGLLSTSSGLPWPRAAGMKPSHNAARSRTSGSRN